MIGIKITGIATAIRRLEALKKRIPDRAKELAERLMKEGYDVASVLFKDARYAGTNDVEVATPVWEDDVLVLRANGDAVAFIEFGTGKGYYEDYPDQSVYSKLGLSNRGEYGKGKGAHPPWRYIGDAGNDGVILKHKNDGTDVVQTYGNNPARAMYQATVTVSDREKILEIAKEVFRK